MEPDDGFLLEALLQLARTAMKLETAKQNRADRYQRTPERKTYRYGCRDLLWPSAAKHGVGAMENKHKVAAERQSPA